MKLVNAKIFKKITCLLIASSLVLTGLTGCGKNKIDTEQPIESSIDSNSDISSNIDSETSFETNKVEITFPDETDAESIMNVTGGIAINSYLVARMKLDKFLQYDYEHGDIEEYQRLLDDATASFKHAEKASYIFDLSAYIWLVEKEESSGHPTYENLSPTVEHNNYNPFITTVYAADTDSPAVKWAKDITERFDKAPAGKGIRTLAEQLGTDSKRAYSQLIQAQNILNGDEYTKIADAANNAYKTANVLKTAGTGAGFVIAVAAAPATTVLGSVVATGGAVVSGVNTLLEIGSTASIIHTNGEGNWITDACDNTEAQFAPVTQIFAVGGLFSNVGNLKSAGKELLNKNGNLFKNILKSNNTAEDVFGLISYGTDALNNYKKEGTILGGSFTKTDSGIKFTLIDTLCGTDSESLKNIEKILKDIGIEESDAKNAVGELSNSLDEKNIASTSELNTVPDASSVASGDSSSDYNDEKIPFEHPQLSPELIDRILDEHEFSTDTENGEDYNDYIDKALDNYYAGVKEIGENLISEIEKDNYDALCNEIDKNMEELLKNCKGPGNPKNSALSKGIVTDEYGISGIYFIEIHDGYGSEDYSDAVVILNPDNTMEISFGLHAVNIIEDDSDAGFHIEKNWDAIAVIENLVGTFDPSTNTFEGKGINGTSGLAADHFDNFTTRLIFNLSSPITAKGKTGEGEFKEAFEKAVIDISLSWKAYIKEEDLQ